MKPTDDVDKLLAVTLKNRFQPAREQLQLATVFALYRAFYEVRQAEVRRLESEVIRDSLLAVTGNLDRTLGGPAIRDLSTNRRTLYVMTIRSDRATYQALFDAADPAAIVEKRLDSTVSPQALFLLNHPFALTQTKSLADLVLKKGPSENVGRIDWLYRRLYGRPASPQEKRIGLAALREADANGKSGIAVEAWERYCQVLLCANEFIYVD